MTASRRTGQRFRKVIWTVAGLWVHRDGQSAETAVSQLSRRVQSYLTRRLRDPELAADLTQEAFLRYAEHPPAMAGEIRNNRSYLYRTAHNLAVDHIRKSARDQTDMPGDTVMAALPDDHPGQEIEPPTARACAICARCWTNCPSARARSLP
ncbi:RNA polymerase sigma factor [Paracoccus sp. DMF-8]|uniref:RNA polymerase sigma factor n=1 Tax=Paracoccus sp. DMF-8 TaxID=3019445 RepID=UPI0023E8233C|nr:RNA polymerase sigma factor [Paracoccus sp. DMF-8]MDF3605798.1 RNA polymerase sigma factor [Paracoccus sp. DMF-8]